MCPFSLAWGHRPHDSLALREENKHGNTRLVGGARGISTSPRAAIATYVSQSNRPVDLELSVVEGLLVCVACTRESGQNPHGCTPGRV